MDSFGPVDFPIILMYLYPTKITRKNRIPHKSLLRWLQFLY